MDNELQHQRERMVAEQIRSRGITDIRLLEAMQRVPRHLFVPSRDLSMAYADGPLPIGEEQTISQPYIVALMTELLQLGPDACVLEVGTGSGYQAAILAELAREVHTVEILPTLHQSSQTLLQELGYDNVQVHLGDGSLGWQKSAPYNGILVAACAPEVPPPLFDQLAENGRLVAPVGSRSRQQLEVWRRTGSGYVCEKNIAVAFVPLRGTFGWG